MAKLLCHSIVSTSGFVLINLLVLMQIIVIIVMACFSRTMLMVKSINDGSQQQALQYDVFQALLRLETHSNLSCHIPVVPWSTITKNSLQWWQANGCHYQKKHIHHYYVIESLGVDACAIVRIDGQAKWVAEYNRVTVYSVADAGQYHPVRLQASYVKPVLSTTQCERQTHRVNTGRQSLREW